MSKEAHFYKIQIFNGIRIILLAYRQVGLSADR